MNEGIKKFAELMKTEEVQDKIRKAMEAYQGEKTPEAVFNNVLTPIANEYGITATYDDLQAYFEEASNQEMSNDEIAQTAGGEFKGGGLGGTACIAVGFGLGGGAGKDGGGVCVIAGVGWGSDFCTGEGVSECFATGAPHGY